GMLAKAHLSVYLSSKMAVRTLTQTAALELGTHGITVNAFVHGGPVMTPMRTPFRIWTGATCNLYIDDSLEVPIGTDSRVLEKAGPTVVVHFVLTVYSQDALYLNSWCKTPRSVGSQLRKTYYSGAHLRECYIDLRSATVLSGQL
ncbi:hypothetical protein K488DRAFT_47244, partial [Vararia minispora EC-137]